MKKIRKPYRYLIDIYKNIDEIQKALGRIETRQIQNEQKIKNAEFKVYSQWGEDGIIQYLINRIEIPNKIFVEFGVENYTEENTRFLLQNNNWAGLVIDGSKKNIEYIKNDPIYWRYNLKAHEAFITKENINELITQNGITGDIGLLSIDIDGNDFWVWRAIECVSPCIVVCEYNSHFGDTLTISVPYDDSFVRSKKHYSNIYYGASIAALELLGKEKGYSLVSSNNAGNNLFFVRDDLIGSLEVFTAKEIYRQAEFREARNQAGELTFDSFHENCKIISQEQMIDVTNNKFITLGDL